MNILSQVQQWKNHLGVRRYAANTLWMFAENILRIIAGVLVGIWVARYLGPTQFGIYNYSLSFCAIFTSAASLGINSIAVRELVNEPGKKDLYLGTVFWLQTTAAVLSILITAVAVMVSGNDFQTNLYIMIIVAGTAFLGVDVVDFYFQSQVLAKFVSICKITQLLLSCCLKIYFVLTGANLICFVIVCAVDQFMLAATLLIAYFSHNKNLRFMRFFSWATAKRMLRDCAPLIISGFAVSLSSRSDQLIIKKFMSEKDVGLFAAATRLTEIGYFIPGILCSSLFPALVNARKYDLQTYYDRFQRLITLLVWIAIGIAIPISFLGNWIITLLYGQAYHAAGTILIITCWTGIFMAMGAACSPWFVAENLQRISLYKTCYGAVSSITLNFILIPIYGIQGAAFSMLFTQVIVSLVSDLFMKKTRFMFFMKLRCFYSYKASARLAAKLNPK